MSEEDRFYSRYTRDQKRHSRTKSEGIYRGQTSQQEPHPPNRPTPENSSPPGVPHVSTAEPNIDPQTTPTKVLTSSDKLPSKDRDVYGGNFPKARRLAIARSSGKCQFCGIRQAKEGHHWAWPDYPSGEKVQHHDITALCKPCHELATIIRSWAGNENADFNLLAGKLENASNFYEKREILSRWLFPEGQQSTEPRDRDYDGPTQDAQKEKPALKADDYIPPRTRNLQSKPKRRQPDTPRNTPKSTTGVWLLLFIITIAIVLTLIFLNPPWPS